MADESGASMTYRFFQDRANQHIAEFEQEAQDARLARRREMHVKPRLSNPNGLALRLVTRLRDSHRHGFRASTDLSIVPSRRTFAPVVDRSYPGATNIDPQMSVRVDAIASTTR
jgi:hypothetical protein